VAGPTPFRPLDGVRVLDLTSSLAGPYCTQILAVLGADVVKIEHPGRGDEARAWGPPLTSGASALFFAANADKRSLALDVSAPDGLEALLRLAERAAVFIQSLRPGTAERLGLGPTDVQARNGDLVYCSIGAFGRRGPLMANVIYFSIIELLSGCSTTFTQFIILRALFGIGMGGEWAAGMPLVLEHWPARLRGLASGLLLGGWYWGYLFAAATFQYIYPLFSGNPDLGWRVMFWIAIVPALLTLWIRSQKNLVS